MTERLTRQELEYAGEGYDPAAARSSGRPGRGNTKFL